MWWKSTGPVLNIQSRLTPKLFGRANIKTPMQYSNTSLTFSSSVKADVQEPEGPTVSQIGFGGYLSRGHPHGLSVTHTHTHTQTHTHTDTHTHTHTHANTNTHTDAQ